MSKEKKLKLVSLELNPDNPRFDAVAGQKDAIDKMLDDQGDKLYNLADHIMKNELNPIDKILVIPHQNKFRVVEGNRRIASLKILSNPELIDDKKYASIKKKFKTLHNNNEEKFPITVSCLVLENLKEAELWIGLKHGGFQNGIGTDEWDPIQKNRYELKTRGRSSISLQFITFLKNSESVPADIKERIETIKTTNVDRLLGDRYVRESMGIDFNNGVLQSNVEEKEVVKGLCKIAEDLLESNFTVRNIYDPEKRKAYIDNLPKKFKPDIKKTTDKPWQLNTAKGPIAVTSVSDSTSSSSNAAVSQVRNKLIPKSVKLKIDQPRINTIFTELQTLDLNKHKNAVAVLFRVFIELSLDFYIEQKNMTPAASSQKSGASLRDKAFQVISNLTNRNIIDSAISKGIRNALKDDNGLIGIETWHAYVHNHRFSPIPLNMIITWDSMQEFVTILWNDI